MNVVALIASRFQTDVCSAYLLEPDRATLVLAATLGLRAQCTAPRAWPQRPGRPCFWWRKYGRLSNKFAFIHASNIFARREKMPIIVPRRSAHRSWRSAGCSRRSDEGRARYRDASPDAGRGSSSGRAGRQRGAHFGPVTGPTRERLWSLARNLWWSWDHDSTGLFAISIRRFRQLNQNPISMLAEIPLKASSAARNNWCCMAASITRSGAIANI